jgi:hypothetical protein
MVRARHRPTATAAMTDDRLSKPARISALIKKIGPWLLIIPSLIVGMLVVELLSHLFLPLTDVAGFNVWMRRVIFYGGSDTIIRNQGNVFTYSPHSELRNVTAFFSDSDFKIEYDYKFRTNNLGLVQDADVVPERDSLLLLGDSFTQGLGAEPLFRLISPDVDKLGFQAINGGLIGTGFEQWLNLDRYLASNNIRVRKLVVLFISGDYLRPVWTFRPEELQCLADLSLCHAEDAYLYRLPPDAELASEINKIRIARTPMLNRFAFKMRVEALLPASYHIYEFFKAQLKDRALDEHGETATRAAISEFIRIYGPDNVAFIHLPQKEELEHGRPINLGLRARRSIQAAGGKLFDGFERCGLSPENYYAMDDHPTRVGYAKIASCTNEVIKEMWTGTR